MKGLTGREYKGEDDIASVAEREPSFHRHTDCYRSTLQSSKTHWYKDKHQSQQAVV